MLYFTSGLLDDQVERLLVETAVESWTDLYEQRFVAAFDRKFPQDFPQDIASSQKEGQAAQDIEILGLPHRKSKLVVTDAASLAQKIRSGIPADPVVAEVKILARAELCILHRQVIRQPEKEGQG